MNSDILNPLLDVDFYDYDLDPSLIAYAPAEPKDSCKLLVYDRVKDKITHATFSDVLDFIPENTKVILNDTKVIKARIYGNKESGGGVELLLNHQLSKNTFNVYIKGKVRVDTLLSFGKLNANVLSLEDDGSRIVEFFYEDELCDEKVLYEVLEVIGHVPLPPYIKREDIKSDELDYQSLFAKNEGAVAAPTASLHFTPELFERVQKKFDVDYVTLHVGAGTFKGVESSNILKHKMHKESFVIPKSTKNIIDDRNNKILSIGTTVTRVVENYVRENQEVGDVDLFLHPLNPPRRVDYLITNFHLPKSTLLMLVCSFVGREKALELYSEAMKKYYRFFSYGDAMMII